MITPIPPSDAKALIVDPDRGVQTVLRRALEPIGFLVSAAERGDAALEAVRRHETDLILLDLGLPDISGLQVIRRIRYAGAHVPIIVLSSRTDEASKVEALDLGADDYLTKPFGIDELLARIRVLQRYRAPVQPPQSILDVGEIRINLNRRGVQVRGQDVRLSPREYDLLRLLMTHAGKVLTHSFIIRSVWGASSDVQYLRIYISSLRRKIERDPENPALLQTEQGVGYRLRLTEPAPRQSASSDGGALVSSQVTSR